MPIEVIMNLLIKLQGGIIGINPLNNELLQCENKRYWMIKNLQYLTELHGPLCRRKKIPEEIKIDNTLIPPSLCYLNLGVRLSIASHEIHVS